MSSPRIKIRCPNCHNDGSARAEFLNRRVSCKHCSHVFRAIPVDDDAAPPAPAPSGSIEDLKREIRQLRDSLSAEHAAAGEAGALREQLKRALDAAREAEGRESALRKEIADLRDRLEQGGSSAGDEARDKLREEELRFLRDQLDKARAEVEAEARRRREVASNLAAKTAEYAQALVTKQDEHAQALKDKEDEHAGALVAKQDEHAGALKALADRLEGLQGEARAVEARRLASDAERAESEGRHADEARALADELERAKGELAGANRALEGLRGDQGRAESEHSRVIEGLKAQVAGLEAERGDADSARLERDRLAGELESHRARLDEAGRLVDEHKGGLDRARLDAETLRHERDEARIQRDRVSEELEALQARLAEADQMAAEWGFASTELEVPRAQDPESSGDFTDQGEGPESGTVFDGPIGPQVDVQSLRDELAEVTAQLARKDSELAEARERAAEQARAEAATLREELEEARASAEAASKANLELSARVRDFEASPTITAPAPTPAPAAAVDPAWLESERKRAVDEAVKGAWADFERRLAETQAKLKAANSRAEMMEVEAREAREQLAARERGHGVGDGSSFEEGASMTSIRILTDRGNARLTPADAEARLGLARQLAVERKDRALIDRITKMADKVHADLEARNYTLAETLVRGAEIETGLDPGGFSINGLKIFRASPTIVGSLNGLAPAFDRVMRQGDLPSIRSTLDEMRTILGDQAGLPEIRRIGRTPSIKRPIDPAEAVRLFLGALENESWLVRPIASKKPLPDTAPGTYAALVEGCCDARGAAERHAPDRLPTLDGVIQACCQMLTRRQQPDGHLSFLDPRGKPSRAASVVEGMVAQRPDAVKDGWVVHVDPVGMAQSETGACAVALATAGKALGRADWSQAARKAADWAMAQPCLPSFVANAASASLLARAYLDARQDRQLAGLARKLTLGLLPGQVENGRWVDAQSATTPNHLLILRALHDAWEAIPADRPDLRDPLKAAVDLATSSLLAECKALGVPPQGNALRDLLRHRALFPNDADPRLAPAILDSATVIQELCHDGPKPKLGVAPDQLAALTRI